MRQFTLTNALGKSYDLNNLDNFLHDPSGLGFQRDNDYIKMGTQYYSYNDGFKQQPVKGTIRFKYPDAYSKYFEFAKFLQHTPLTLKYASNDEYSLQVLPGKLVKTELESKSLECDIELTPLSLYYKHIVEENEETETTGKVYDYEYPYSYAENIPGTVVIESDSANESPCKIQIYGPAVNPHWYHYVNGELVTEGKVTATIANGNKLIVDTSVVPYAIKSVDSYGNLVKDLYQASDFSLDRFVFLRYGTNRISVGHDGTTTLALSVEAKIAYETV